MNGTSSARESGPRGEDGLDPVRDAVLEKALPEIPWEGWSETALARAVRAADLTPGLEKLVFPRGAEDLVRYYLLGLDQKLEEKLAAADLTGMKVRERIAFAVRTRLELAAPHKEAARRAMAFLALPQRAGLAASVLAHTVDAIWRGIGDRSTDFNFYTKRAILAAVYSATFLYWLADESDGCADTWAFLGRRINDVMRFESVKARLRTAVKALPSPLGVLGALRYPGR